MGNRATRLLCVLALTITAAACGDDGGGSPDARPCVPVNDNNDCTTDVCQNNVPVNDPVAAGTACATGTCNATGMCIAPTCTDNMENGTETDVDCGGSCAPGSRCDDGEGCAVPGDCTSGVCTAMLCVAARCGDGVQQGTEMCDDGNDTNGDGCDDGAGDACRATGCGNGVVTGTEVCDDGNAVNGDGCDNNCTTSACGNGVTAGTEACDDGDTMGTDGCSATCTVEAGYMCTGTPSVCVTMCGDGIVAGTEACDDMPPAEAGDGCSATCTVESGFMCSGSPSVCVPLAVCGNGVLESGEACDQGGGNVANGDGCSSMCAIETGWACTGTPSVCSPVCGNGVITPPETCDDNNTNPVDGCGATCRIEPTEIEPNDDGVVATGASGITGNDFDAAGGIAVGNANTNGAFNVANGNTAVIAAIGVAGDEDVFAITNTSALPQSVRFDVWSRAAGFGFNMPCPDAALFDTGLHIRNAAGVSLASNDDRSAAADRCSGLTFTMTPGQTVYAHVMEFGDNLALNTPGYGLQIRPTPIVCGDGSQAPGLEECDDGNLVPGDGCNATCVIEGTNEVEPNEDGTPATGGSGIAGNDFDAAGGMAVANATAQGVVNIGTTGRIWLAALTPAGDEDVFAVNNGAAGPMEVTVDTWDPLSGLGRACPSTVDTGINVRDAAGAILASNDQRVTGDNCSRVVFAVPAGQSRYVHVTDFGDNSIITRYVTQITRRPVVCGDTVVTPGIEECDDGNTIDTDACTNMCLVGGAINETEPNGTVAEADAATLRIMGDTIVRAAIGSTTDVDLYRMEVSAASVIRLETFAPLPGGCDASTTTIRLLDNAGTEITNDNAGATNGSGIASCAAMVFPAAPGTYYVRVEETGVNAAIARYFLQAEFQTDAGAEAEPANMMGTNDTNATASVNLMTATDSFVFGDHTLIDDTDVYVVTVPAGRGLRAEIVEGDRAAETCESNGVDSRLTLFNGTTQLVDDDDDGRGFCSLIDGTGASPRDSAARNGTAAPVTWHVHVRRSGTITTPAGQFVYRLQLTVR